MHLAIYLPLVLPLLAAAAARPLAVRLPPAAATWLLVLSAIALALASSAPAAIATGTAAGSCWLITGLDIPASDSTNGTRTRAVSASMPSTALLASASASALRTSSQVAATGGSRPASGRAAVAASSGTSRGR